MRFEHLLRLAILVTGLFLVPWGARGAEPTQTQLVAELIWGTNGEKPAGQDLKPIAPDLERRLRNIFKWRNYFGIQRKEFATTRGKVVKVEMSKECRVEVTQVDDQEFEIALFGKGLLVVKKTQRIIPEETVVLGGDDKNDTAWFVVLNRARPSGPRR